jgi:hypothetical protein
MKTIEIIMKPNEFFFNFISMESKRVRLNQDLEFYLVDLMCRFIKAENFYLNTDRGLKDTPLCLLLKEAEDEVNLEVKRLLFRQIGDLALFTTGFIRDKNVSTYYYQTLGKSAYSSTALLYSKPQLKDRYRDLSTNFDLITGILNTIPNSFNLVK